MDELDEKMKFLEIAEKILARKNQIVEIKNSISTLMDDFTKNWKIDGPQALRWVFFYFVGVRISNFSLSSLSVM